MIKKSSHARKTLIGSISLICILVLLLNGCASAVTVPADQTTAEAPSLSRASTAAPAEKTTPDPTLTDAAKETPEVSMPTVTLEPITAMNPTTMAEPTPFVYPQIYQTGSYISVIADSTNEYDESVKKQVDFTFDGVAYTGEYAVTWKTGTFQIVDYYNCYINGEKPENNITAYYDHVTGAFIGIAFSGGIGQVTGDWKEKDLERAKEIAASLIGEEALEAYAYTFRDRKFFSTWEYPIRYDWQIFLFAKMIGPYETYDQIQIEFTPKGRLSAVYVSNVGRFDELKEPNVDHEKLQASIEQSLTKYYDLRKCRYEIVEQDLVTEEDGKLLMLTKVIVIDNASLTDYLSISTEL